MSYLRGDERTGQSGVFDREELEQVPGERGYRGFGGSGNFPSSLTVNWGCLKPPRLLDSLGVAPATASPACPFLRLVHRVSVFWDPSHYLALVLRTPHG